MIPNRTTQQEAVLLQLTQKFEIETDRILFLNPERPDEPWIPAEELMSIARQVGGFKSIIETFDQYIPELNQVVHIATVVDAQDRSYCRSGVATRGETIPNTAEVLDEHALASARALSAALRAAGFYPLRAGSVLDLHLPDKSASPNDPVVQATVQRNNDLAQIHILAKQKGLIKEGTGGRKDLSGYKTWCFENWGVDGSGALNPVERQAAINVLKQMSDADTVIA